jgi:hypothetical protein
VFYRNRVDKTRKDSSKRVDVEKILKLKEIKSDWDKFMDLVEPIGVERENFPINLVKYIHKELQGVFFPLCGLENEICWIENTALTQKIKKRDVDLYNVIENFIFKPRGTETQYGWLSTGHINKVMKQYQQVYPNFRFIDCIPSNYYNLHPEEFPFPFGNSTKLAIVFNIDEAHESGSHWIAVFIDNTTTELLIEHFDPTGDYPIKNIQRFIRDPIFKKIGKKVVYKVNKFKHQKGDSECGVFSLFYIQKRLEGYKFEDFQKTRIPDDLMNQYRSTFFRS